MFDKSVKPQIVHSVVPHQMFTCSEEQAQASSVYSRVFLLLFFCVVKTFLLWRGGRELMISPASPTWPVESYLSAHLSSSAQSGPSCWLHCLCLQRRDMKNATEVTVFPPHFRVRRKSPEPSRCSTSILTKIRLPLVVSDVSQKIKFSSFFSAECTKDGFKENHAVLKRPLIW